MGRGYCFRAGRFGYRENEVPIGAVVLDKSGKIISKATMLRSIIMIHVGMLKFWLYERRVKNSIAGV